MYNFYKLNPLQVGQGIYIPDGFIEYDTNNVPQELQEALALEKDKDELQAKINEAQTYLNDTDHKMYSDYERKEDETQEVMDYIKEQRSIARAFIRANQGVSNGL